MTFKKALQEIQAKTDSIEHSRCQIIGSRRLPRLSIGRIPFSLHQNKQINYSNNDQKAPHRIDTQD